MALLRPTLTYDDLADSDLIIEAVFETLSIKKEVFAKLDQVAKSGAILASNTSYLAIDEIASSTRRPGDVLGMHFFSPANVMRLLEIVFADKTLPDVLATMVDLARRINKVGVVCRNSEGFIGNRMLAGYRHQALLMGLEGAEPAQVDAAALSLNSPCRIDEPATLRHHLGVLGSATHKSSVRTCFRHVKLSANTRAP